MSAHVTTEQMKQLWNGDIAEIERGDDLGVLTADDLAALMDGAAIDPGDWTTDGDPAEHMWETLAGQFNSDVPGGTTSSAQDASLQDVLDARTQLDNALAAVEALRTQLGVEGLEVELHEAIRRALETRAPRQAIADNAKLSVPRLYQIRDGRR